MYIAKDIFKMVELRLHDQFFLEILFKLYLFISFKHNSTGGVMVRVLALSAVDRGFDPRSGQSKDYEIGICCFSTKYATLRRKGKD